LVASHSRKGEPHEAKGLFASFDRLEIRRSDRDRGTIEPAGYVGRERSGRSKSAAYRFREHLAKVRRVFVAGPIATFPTRVQAIVLLEPATVDRNGKAAAGRNRANTVVQRFVALPIFVAHEERHHRSIGARFDPRVREQRAHLRRTTKEVAPLDVE